MIMVLLLINFALLRMLDAKTKSSLFSCVR